MSKHTTSGRGYANPVSGRKTRAAASAAIDVAGRLLGATKMLDDRSRATDALLAGFLGLSLLGRVYWLLSGKLRARDLDRINAEAGQ